MSPTASMRMSAGPAARRMASRSSSCPERGNRDHPLRVHPHQLVEQVPASSAGHHLARAHRQHEEHAGAADEAGSGIDHHGVARPERRTEQGTVAGAEPPETDQQGGIDRGSATQRREAIRGEHEPLREAPVPPAGEDPLRGFSLAEGSDVAGLRPASDIHRVVEVVAEDPVADVQAGNVVRHFQDLADGVHAGGEGQGRKGIADPSVDHLGEVGRHEGAEHPNDGGARHQLRIGDLLDPQRVAGSMEPRRLHARSGERDYVVFGHGPSIAPARPSSPYRASIQADTEVIDRLPGLNGRIRDARLPRTRPRRRRYPRRP